MSDEETVALVCVAAFVIAAIVLLAYMIITSKPFTYKKRVGNGTAYLTVTAKKRLNRVSLIAKVGDEDIDFERKRVNRGQTVEFVYPASNKPAKLTVEVESGGVQVVSI